METPAPIGIFDSGVGGLSVLRAVRQALPALDVFYLADQAHVPYGSRPAEQVRSFAEGITRYLLDQGACLVVVACNTASAAALHHLRKVFPSIPFVGMEPAVKPAAETTQTGVVGVLATPATFQGELYASVVERFAQGVTVLQDTCPGLVELIEAGDLNGPQTRLILESALLPMLKRGIDTVVLGCTHYPFVIPLIQQIVGPQVRVIDPSPAIARQVARLLADLNHPSLQALAGSIPPPTLGQIRYTTTNDPTHLASQLEFLVGESAPVTPLFWSRVRLPPKRTTLSI